MPPRSRTSRTSTPARSARRRASISSAARSANIITGGAGNDTIDGGGGADVIDAGAGDDTVAYRGTETSIAGGTGTNTLQLKAVVTVDLANADQTTGDAVNVSAFENVDASALSAAQGVSISGDAQGNTITGGAGNDVIDGRGGADVIDAGSGNDTVHYHGTEVLIDGGFGSNTLVIDNPGGITHVDLSVAPGSDQTTGDTVNVANFQNIDASILTTALVVTGSSSANAITTGSGNDTIDGGGGADTINAGAGNDTVVVLWLGSLDRRRRRDQHAGTEGMPRQSISSSADQTTGDSVTVANFTNVDASALAVGADDHRLGGGQHHHRRRRQRHHRRRRRRRYPQCRRWRRSGRRRTVRKHRSMAAPAPTRWC